MFSTDRSADRLQDYISCDVANTDWLLVYFTRAVNSNCQDKSQAQKALDVIITDFTTSSCTSVEALFIHNRLKMSNPWKLVLVIFAVVLLQTHSKPFESTDEGLSEMERGKRIN